MKRKFYKNKNKVSLYTDGILTLNNVYSRPDVDTVYN